MAMVILRSTFKSPLVSLSMVCGSEVLITLERKKVAVFLLHNTSDVNFLGFTGFIESKFGPPNIHTCTSIKSTIVHTFYM